MSQTSFQPKRRFSVRPAEPKDAGIYAEWLEAAQDINLIDKDVYTYPTCQTLVVEKNDEPQLINSFHAVIVMEALAPKPGVSPLTEAKALIELIERVKQIAREAGIKEIMFGCKDETLAAFAPHHGFEKLNFPVFRAKL